jgi:hypothetical protein
MAFTTSVNAKSPFHVYTPSPESKQLWVIAAKPSRGGIELAVKSKEDLDFQRAPSRCIPNGRSSMEQTKVSKQREQGTNKALSLSD